jgi:hypothetical protein
MASFRWRRTSPWQRATGDHSSTRCEGRVEAAAWQSKDNVPILADTCNRRDPFRPFAPGFVSYKQEDNEILYSSKRNFLVVVAVLGICQLDDVVAKIARITTSDDLTPCTVVSLHRIGIHV